MMAGPKLIAGGLAAMILAVAAQGAAAATRLPIQGIVISKDATQNMACAAGVCTATASSAVLNIADLHQMLSQSNLTISTGSIAQDIDFAVNFKWIGKHTLTLGAQHSIEIDRAITVAGDGGLTLTTNGGGTDGQLIFGSKGNVNFWSLSSALTINGAAYTLVDDIATLASDIAAKPSGNYALAQSIVSTINYPSSPIPTAFGGTFEGLGNTISNFSIFDMFYTTDALFAYVYNRGTLRDIGLLNVSIKNSNSNGNGRPASLVVESHGAVLQAYATGTAGCDDRFYNCTSGGLISVNYGSVANSWAAVRVAVGEGSEAGGLIGNDHGPVSNSFATGNVSGFQGADEGGLIGYVIGHAKIINCYATGTVNGSGTALGGLIGSVWEYATASLSYASGTVNGGTYNGGLLGDDSQPGHFHNTFWDLEGSGIFGPSDGAGYPLNDPGIKGLHETQLQTALPPGFSATDWTIKPSINNGLPYLIVNPPI